jgi:hypothetical protein
MSQIAGTATVTGKIGPDSALTAQVFSDVKGIDFQLDRQVIGIRYGSPEKTVYVEYANIATVTFTISAGVTTDVTIST